MPRNTQTEVQVTTEDRRRLLARLADADGHTIPWQRLTGAGVYTANALARLGYARINKKGDWTLELTARGLHQLTAGRP